MPDEALVVEAFNKYCTPFGVIEPEDLFDALAEAPSRVHVLLSRSRVAPGMILVLATRTVVECILFFISFHTRKALDTYHVAMR